MEFDAGNCNKRIDMVGQKFGFLEVIGFSHSCSFGSYWKCKCICGNIVNVFRTNLLVGNVRSCGCKSKELQKETNLERYGCKSSFQNKDVREKFIKNNIEKYGVEYPAQISEIALKSAKKSKNTFIIKHWKTEEDLVCQASYEKKVVEYLNRNAIDFEWQKYVFFVFVDGKKRTYRPDIFLIEENKWIEIKGYKRYLGMMKWNYFQSQYKNSELWDKQKLEEMGIL